MYESIWIEIYLGVVITVEYFLSCRGEYRSKVAIVHWSLLATQEKTSETVASTCMTVSRDEIRA
jgi:hypothetical protein